MTLQNVLDEFLLQKRLDGLSDPSVISYSNNLKLFVCFVGPELSIGALHFDLVASYILDLRGRSLSKATISSYVRDLKIFLKWISETYTLPFNYTRIKVPKSPKKNVKMYTPDEIQLVFSLCSAENEWLTARNRAILAFFYDSGLRQCEIVSMERENINFSMCVVKVTGKGAKDRTVSMGKTTAALLSDYLRICPFESDMVFVGRHGNPMSKNAIKKFMHKLRTQLPFSLSSHRLRHNFGTNFCIDHIRQTGSSQVYDLSILMGHESIETTKRYEHFAHELIAAENSISHLDLISSRHFQKSGCLGTCTKKMEP